MIPEFREKCEPYFMEFLIDEKCQIRKHEEDLSEKTFLTEVKWTHESHPIVWKLKYQFIPNLMIKFVKS